LRRRLDKHHKVHPKTCKLCNENYFANGFCLRHYHIDYKKRWNDRHPRYNKRYGRNYWKLKKKDLQFLAKRKAYMKIYNLKHYVKKKLAKKSKPEDIPTITVTIP